MSWRSPLQSAVCGRCHERRVPREGLACRACQQRAKRRSARYVHGFVRTRPVDQPPPVVMPRQPIRTVVINGQEMLVVWDGSIR